MRNEQHDERHNIPKHKKSKNIKPQNLDTTNDTNMESTERHIGFVVFLFRFKFSAFYTFMFLMFRFQPFY